GLVTITGGKWTTYRQMAEDAINEAERVAGLATRPSPTTDLRLHGWSDETSEKSHWRAYGSDVPHLRELLRENVEWSEPLHPGLPGCAGEVIWATRREMARTVE